MPKINRTPQNPHGLSLKQTATIADIINDVKTGKGISPAKSTAKFYKAKSKKVFAVIATENLNRPNFRVALLEGLSNAKILGKNSKIETGLMAGLEAVQATHTRDGDFTDIDYRTRLAYIQEINKIAGVYAPEKRQNLQFNIEGTPEEVRQRVENLRSEMGNS